MPHRPAAAQVSLPVAPLLALLLALPMTQVFGLVDFDRMRALAGERFGARGISRVSAWQEFLTEAASLPLAEQLAATNAFFNERVRWRTDQRIYGTEDYWATPLETLGHGEADCEDFTIAKYATLLSLGVQPQSLRLVYVKARLAGGGSQAHMVLAWYENPAALPLILDNINTLVLPADQRQDLTPIFSFNADDLWISGADQPSSANPQARLSRWRQVLERMADEGLRGNW